MLACIAEAATAYHVPVPAIERVMEAAARQKAGQPADCRRAAMSRLIDRALLPALLVILAILAAHLLSLMVGAVLMTVMTAIEHALNYALRRG